MLNFKETIWSSMRSEGSVDAGIVAWSADVVLYYTQILKMKMGSSATLLGLPKDMLRLMDLVL